MFQIKRFFILAALIAVGSILALADAVADFAASRSINAPQAAVMIVDIKTGEVVGQHNVDFPLIPASIMKSVTTATLLKKIGPKFRYETPVYLIKTVPQSSKDDCFQGIIKVVASGDPSINSTHDPGSEDLVAEIIQLLKYNGIKCFRGKIIVDESAFPGPAVNPTWHSADLTHYYGTGTHGFNFEDNASGKKSVKDPASVFVSRLRSAMNAAGIRFEPIDENSNIDEFPALIHVSAPADEIMRSCMMRSDNQFAESMLRLVGKHCGGEASSARGAKEMLRYWKNQGAHADGVKIVDGSGLSRDNRVTARFMVDVLNDMAKNPYYASFFPLAGQEGTLKNLLAGTELEGYIAMKTGSMSGVQCYAGYKLDDDYVPTHVVVIIMNEMKDRAAARREVEKMLLNTFKQ